MAMEKVTLKPMNIGQMTLRIRNIEGSSLVLHNWSEKAKEEMRRKKDGQRTKLREPCNPEAECEAATYRLPDGAPGFPARGIKAAICSAAHKDLGVERTLIRKGLFIHADGSDGIQGLVRIDSPGSKMREDYVRVGMDGTDLRYRPEFQVWEMLLRIEYDADQLRPDVIVNLINRAGYGVGIGEARPERDGDWGRFEVVTEDEPPKRGKK